MGNITGIPFTSGKRKVNKGAKLQSDNLIRPDFALTTSQSHTFQVNHIEKQETEENINEYEEIIVMTVTNISRAEEATRKGESD